MGGFPYQLIGGESVLDAMRREQYEEEMAFSQLSGTSPEIMSCEVKMSKKALAGDSIFSEETFQEIIKMNVDYFSPDHLSQIEGLLETVLECVDVLKRTKKSEEISMSGDFCPECNCYLIKNQNDFLWCPSPKCTFGGPLSDISEGRSRSNTRKTAE